jgi:hypothetical protein
MKAYVRACFDEHFTLNRIKLLTTYIEQNVKEHDFYLNYFFHRP